MRRQTYTSIREPSDNSMQLTAPRVATGVERQDLANSFHQQLPDSPRADGDPGRSEVSGIRIWRAGRTEPSQGHRLRPFPGSAIAANG